MTATASAPRASRSRARATISSRIDFGAHRPVGQHAFAHLDAPLARDHRLELAPQAPGLRTITAAHFQHVAKSFRGDDACLAALALQQRVGADRRAVNDGADLRQVAGALAHAVEEAVRFATACRRHLADPRTSARFIQEEQVGERPADVHTDDQLARHAAPLCAAARHIAVVDVTLRSRPGVRSFGGDHSRRRPVSRDAPARPSQA